MNPRKQNFGDVIPRLVMCLFCTMLASAVRAGALQETVLPEPLSWVMAMPTMGSAPEDTCSMNLIGESYGISSMPYVPGDTDNDGLYELITAVSSESFTRFLEVQGDGSYLEVHLGPNIIPYAAGDFDGDGRGDLLGQRGNHLDVYEASDSLSHPTILKWQHLQPTNIIGYATVGDTDQDGNIELIHSINSAGSSQLVIFESTADDTYVQKFSYSLDDLSGWKQIADLDGDNNLEVVLSTPSGHVYVFEAIANDTWVKSTDVETGLGNALAVAGGVDTDENGFPELFVSGDVGGGLQRAYIFEAVSDDSIVSVSSLDYFSGYNGASFNDVADVDGDGKPEFLMVVFSRILVFDSVSIGAWSLTCAMYAPDSHHRFLCFDANKNGVSEVYWSEIGGALSNTVFLEHPGTTTSAPFYPAHTYFSVSPNPVRNLAVLLLTNGRAVGGHSLATYDVTGRLVQHDAWNGSEFRATWSPRGLASGNYYVVLEDPGGSIVAKRRVTVVR